jgi:hypothetical protein
MQSGSETETDMAYDYDPLKLAILKHLRKHFQDKPFSLLNVADLGDKLNAERNQIKSALTMLAQDKCILHHDKLSNPNGGSPFNVYVLGDADTKPIPRKTAKEHQAAAEERWQRMNAASLRLAKALGISTRAPA